MNAIQQTIKLMGSQAALAKQLGVSRQFISQIVKGTRPMPPRYAIRIEYLTLGKISAKQLRPDIFDPDFGGKSNTLNNKGPDSP